MSDTIEIKSPLRAGQRTKQLEECIARALNKEVIAYAMPEGTVIMIEANAFQEMSDKAWKYDDLSK